MPSSSQSVAKSILSDKKHLLYYHRYHYLLRPKVMPILLDVEQAFNEIPPLSLTKEEFYQCLGMFESLLRKIAGYSFYLSMETVKEGFKDINFHSTYTNDERKEIVDYIYQQHESFFNHSIEQVFILSIDSCHLSMKNYFRSYLLSEFSALAQTLFKDVFQYYLMNENINLKGEYLPNISL